MGNKKLEIFDLTKGYMYYNLLFIGGENYGNKLGTVD